MFLTKAFAAANNIMKKLIEFDNHLKQLIIVCHTSLSLCIVLFGISMDVTI